MQGAWYHARASWRSRWRGAIALALSIGVVGGLALAAAGGARRADTALPRLLSATGASDVGVFHPALRADDVERLPRVEVVGEAVYAGINFPTVALEERELLVPFAAADHDQYRTIDRPKVVAGRLSDPNEATEITVSEMLAKRRHLRLGDPLRAQPMTPAELAEAQSGDHEGPFAGPFTGPVLDLKVVGIVRLPADLSLSTDEVDSGFVGGSEQLYLTPAFHRTYTRDQLGFTGLSVRLRGGEHDVAAFLRDVRRLAGGPIEDASISGPANRRTQGAIHIEAVALYVFAALVGIAAIAVFGQTLSRDVSFEAERSRALYAIGMTRRQRTAAGMARAAVIVGLGTVIAICVGVAASARFPIGLARLAEPHPGLDVNVGVLLGAAGLMTFSLLAVITRASWRAAAIARSEPPRRPSTLVRTMTRTGLPLSVVNGARLAVTPGRGTSAIPVASTLAGLVTAMVALSASAVFGSSLDRLVNTPALQGWAWDAYVRAPDDASADTMRSLARRVAADPAVAELARTSGRSRVRLRATGAPASRAVEVFALAIDPIEGHVFPPLVTGRAPHGRDEIVLPPRLARRLGVSIGDRMEIAGVSAELRVVGTAVFPDTVLASADVSGDGVLVSPTALSVEGDTQGGGFVARFAPSADSDAAASRLEGMVGNDVAFRLAADVRNLSRARWTPAALAAALGSMGLATLTHLLVTAIRRRRRDFAVLRAIGLTRRNVSRTVAWQATTLVALSLVFSVPIGIVAGRMLWRIVATDLGVVPAPAVPYGAITLAAIGAVVLGNAIAFVPGRSAGRVSAVAALRAE